MARHDIQLSFSVYTYTDLYIKRKRQTDKDTDIMMAMTTVCSTDAED